VLRPDAEALEDHRLHSSLQLRHVLGCRHDRVAAQELVSDGTRLNRSRKR
jgi:hypothetical protein